MRPLIDLIGEAGVTLIQPNQDLPTDCNAYCDGAIIHRNPSEIGGSYAWVVVSASGPELLRQSRIATPTSEGIEYITNNLTELLAAISVLETMPDHWSGTLYSDSEITIKRMRKSAKVNKTIPLGVSARLRKQQKRLGLPNKGKWQLSWVRGHPTGEELRKGFTLNGGPVSIWNVLCDDLCQKIIEEYLTKRKQ